MGDRKGDVRIYLISCFFFVCTIGGGVFLCMYILLPDSEPYLPWYLIVGMTLVALPWLFWFLIYLYRCFGPTNVVHLGGEHHHHNHHGSNGTIGTPKSAPTAPVTSPCGAKPSEYHSPDGGGGQCRVQFGAVVEMGNNQHHHNEDVAHTP